MILHGAKVDMHYETTLIWKLKNKNKNTMWKKKKHWASAQKEKADEN